VRGQRRGERARFVPKTFANASAQQLTRGKRFALLERDLRDGRGQSRIVVPRPARERDRREREDEEKNEYF
jgi:hypothetical protein